MGFVPSNIGEAGSYHRLDVQIREERRCPKCRIQARIGYYAGVQTGPGSIPETPAIKASIGPIADIGFVQMNVGAGMTVQLDGSGSGDPAGNPITYRWCLTAPAGSSAVLSGPEDPRPSFMTDKAGKYVVELIVSNGDLSSAAAKALVLVRDPREGVDSLRSPDMSRTIIRSALNLITNQPDPEEAAVQKSIMAARDYNWDLDGLAIDVDITTARDAKNKPLVKIDLQIGAENVAFRVDGDRHVGQLRITAFYADSKGKLLGADWKRMDLHLYEATYQRILQKGIAYSTTIPLKSPSQIIRVIVYDLGSNRMGSRLMRVK